MGILCESDKIQHALGQYLPHCSSNKGVKGSILGIGQEYLIGIIKYENFFAVNFNFSSLFKMKMKVFSLTH